MRIRNASWLLRAVSLVTFVALVVAPACAPLCASQNCRRADTSGAAGGNCHGAGTVPHEAQRAHALLSCGSPELPAVVLSPTPLGDASCASRLGALDGKFLKLEQENSAAAASFSDFYFGRPREFLSSLVLAPSGVLRI